MSQQFACTHYIRALWHNKPVPDLKQPVCWRCSAVFVVWVIVSMRSYPELDTLALSRPVCGLQDHLGLHSRPYLCGNQAIYSNFSNGTYPECAHILHIQKSVLILE